MARGPPRVGPPLLAFLSLLRGAPAPEPGGPPDCELVALAYLGDSGQTCLHVGKEPEPNNGSVGRCYDTPGWFDGTNGCKQYAKWGQEFCDKYGATAFNSQGPANQHCCVCGGGHVTYFSVGDNVEIDTQIPCESDADEDEDWAWDEDEKNCSQAYAAGEWKQARVTRIMNQPGTLYVVRLQDPRVRGNFQVYLGMGDGERIRKPAERRKHAIRRCGADRGQIWRLRRANESGSSDGKDFLVTLQNPATGLFMGGRTWDIGKAAFARELPGEPLRLRSSSDRFPNLWYILGSHLQPGETTDFCLVGGAFGQATFKEPRWTSCQDGQYKNTPYQRWSMRCVGEGEGADGDGGAALDHAAWLRRKAATKSGLEALERLPPWIVLNVEREASTDVVKVQFRELSRLLHPDKQRVEEDRRAAEVIFPLLQRAHSGLKSGAGDEKFRKDSEVEELLYAHSRHVTELDVPALQALAPDALEAAAKESNDTAVNSTVWLVVLYSSRCSMSRMVKPLVELVAEHLQASGVQVGAFGCGMHGAVRLESMKIGHMAVFKDEACGQFGKLTETPSIHAVGPGLHLALGHAHAERLGERMLDLGSRASRLLRHRHLLQPVTQAMLSGPSDGANDAFANERWVVCFVDANKSARGLLDNSLLAFAPSIASQLTNASVNVGVAACCGDPPGESGETPATPTPDGEVDCVAEGVAWLPQVRIYGVGRGGGKGRSLLGEPFGEVRDAELALQAMANSLLAELGVEPVEDEQEDAARPLANPPEDQQGGGSGNCGQGGPPPASGHPEKLPSGPRLAPGSDVASTPRLAPRTPQGPRGRGMVYGGSGGGGGGGALPSR